MTTDQSTGSVCARTVRRTRGWMLVVAAAWLTPSAQADPVRYEYQGVVTSAAPETDVQPGATFRGSFTFDPEAKPTLTTTGAGGSTQYLYGRSPSVLTSTADDSALEIHVGNKTGYTLMGGLGVSVASNGSSSVVSIASSPADPGPVAVALDFKNPAHALNPAAVSPPETLSLADFPQATFTMLADANTPESRALYSGTIQSLTLVTPVPEPASVATWLGLATLGALGWRRRSRRGALAAA